MIIKNVKGMKISNLDLEIMNDCVFSCHYSNWEPCANSVIKSDLVQYCFGFRDFKWKEIASCSVFLRGVDYLWRFFSFFLSPPLTFSLSFVQFVYLPFFSISISYSFPSSPCTYYSPSSHTNPFSHNSYCHPLFVRSPYISSQMAKNNPMVLAVYWTLQFHNDSQ